MKEQIQQLIAGGQTKDALNLLVQVNPDALLLQAQYNNGEKQFNLGLIGFSEWGRIQARVNYLALEMAGKLSNSPTQSNISSPIQTENMLLTFDKLFERIKRDIDAKNYDYANIHSYAETLNRLTNTTVFNSLLDPTKTSDWERKLNAEKNQVLKEILESIWAKKESLRTRLEVRVDKDNAEVEFNEVLSAFFTEPNRNRWELLHKLLSKRFADKSLFDLQVLEAWEIWEQKLNSIQTDLDWGLDFQGSQEQKDLQRFLNKNLEIKNWNA